MTYRVRAAHPLARALGYSSRMRKLICTATLSLVPMLAQAHPGHASDTGFAAGLLHPLTGMDHLAGIVVAGMLLGWLPTRVRWLACAAFLGTLGVTHALWSADGAQAGFTAGLLAASAGLVAAGMAATKLVRITAAAAR
jgi:urease accessory protein